MYYVYLIKSTDNNNVYKGFTNDINRRLKEHLAGNVRSTKYMLPLDLIHVEICNTRSEARKLELFFKSGYGREVIEEIINNLTRMW